MGEFKVEEVKPRDTVAQAVRTTVDNVFAVGHWLNAVDVNVELSAGAVVAVQLDAEHAQITQYAPGQWIVKDSLGTIKVYDDADFHAMFLIRVA